ncbi:hypothetical protein ABQG65_08865 [Yersinia alsatica]|uniref:hypothetical protein n=1 Tax=Yersinia alsatica TaxID=2890317 RepID=UPI0032EC2050
MLRTTFTSKLAQIARDTGEPNLMLHIKHACHRQQAFCFSADDAVLILRPCVSAELSYVVVWLAISTSPNGMTRYLPTVRYLTRRMGGRWAEFYTSRKGFIRIAQRAGFMRMVDEGGLMRFKIPV